MFKIIGNGIETNKYLNVYALLLLIDNSIDEVLVRNNLFIKSLFNYLYYI